MFKYFFNYRRCVICSLNRLEKLYTVERHCALIPCRYLRTFQQYSNRSLPDAINYTEKLQKIINLEIPTKKKQILFEKTWEELKNTTNLSEKHFLQKLECFKTCGTKVIPKVFMNEVKAAGLDPSEVMLKLLLGVVAEHGDVGYVSSVVTSMKSRNYQADDGVFASLIIAHSVRGDFSSAREVIKTMEECKVHPGSATYCSLMRSAAMSGDYASLHTYRTLASDNRVALTSDQVIRVLETVVKSGREHLIPSLKSSLKIVSDEEISTLANDLLYEGLPSAGYSLLTLIKDNNTAERCQKFVQKMFDCEASLSQMILVGERMAGDKSYGRALYDITKQLILIQNVDGALLTLKSCLKVDLPVRPHLFWPIFKAVRREHGENGIYKILEEMKKMEIFVDNETLEFILPHLTVDEGEAVLKRLQDASGANLSGILKPFLSNLVRNGFLTQALELATKYKYSLNLTDVEPLLLSLAVNYRACKDHVTVCQILKLVNVRHIADWLKMVFSSSNRIPPQEIISLLKELKKIECYITSADEQAINSALNRRQNASPDVSKALGLLTTTQSSSFDFTGSSNNVEDLECHLRELKAKGMNTRGVLRRLVQDYCRVGDVAGARRAYKEILSVEGSLSPGIVSAMMHVNVQAGQLDDALEFHRKLSEEFPHFSIDAYKIIDLATLLVYSNHYQDALDLIKNNTQRRLNKKSFESWEKNCWDLLTATADTEGQHAVTQMLHTLMDHNYCLATTVVLGPAVRAHLNSNDIEGAVNTFTKLATEYKKTPLQQEMISAALSSNNEGLLSQVMSAVESVHGVESSRAVLVAALANRGDVELLKKVIQEIPEVNNTYLRNQIERMCELGQVEAMKLLLDICCKTSIADHIIDAILRHYHRLGDVEEALEWWSTLERTGVSLTREHRTTLANLVSSCAKI